MYFYLSYDKYLGLFIVYVLPQNLLLFLLWWIFRNIYNLCSTPKSISKRETKYKVYLYKKFEIIMYLSGALLLERTYSVLIFGYLEKKWK